MRLELGTSNLGLLGCGYAALWGSPSGLPPGFGPARVETEVTARINTEEMAAANCGTPGGSPAAGQKAWPHTGAEVLPQNG